MSVLGTTSSTSHRRADEILLDVEIHQGFHGSLQHRLDDTGGHNGLCDDALATTFDPVDRRGF